MKAAVCYEFGKPLVVEEIDIDPPQKGEVKVRIAATAICHSDIHAIRGDRPINVPLVPGHESAGYVEEVGESVESVKPGDTVVVSLLFSCGQCVYCCTGRPNLCETKRPLDTESRLRNKQGQRLAHFAHTASLAEYAIVDQSQVVKIPEEMPLDRASLLACGFITGFGAVVNYARVKPLSSVVVIGLGGVGLSSVQGALISGAYPIIAVDMLDSKLESAKTFGATHTINGGQGDAVEAVRQLTSGRGADYVFVAVGSSAAIQQGFSMSCNGGTTVVLGLPPLKDTLTISPIDLVYKAKVLEGCNMGATRLSVDIPKLVDLYLAGRLKLDELITNRYPLEQVNEAIESVERGEALRNVIVFK